MSSDVWNVAQSKNASQGHTFGSLVGSIGIASATALGVATQGVSHRYGVAIGSGCTFINPLGQIVSTCKEMLANFWEIEEDQNQYKEELAELNYEYGMLQNDISYGIDKLLAEIKVLEAKEQNGTITEEEKKELAEKKANFESLLTTSNSKSNQLNNDIKSKQQDLATKYSQKKDLALDYGNQAIEKGSEVAGMSVEDALNSDIDQKIFNAACAIGDINKITGVAAVKVGTELVDKVNELD